MREVVSRTLDPGLARIKLAWWREQLEALDSARPPAEPRLQAVTTELLPCGISGSEVSEIEPGWATLLDEPADPHLVADRGARLFTMIATVVGGSDPAIADAGAFWALSSVTHRNVPGLLELASVYRDRIKGVKFPMRLRGLSLLARLAADPGGTSRRSRVIPALVHIWSGVAVRRS